MEKSQLTGIVVGGIVLGFAVGAGTMQVINKKKSGAGAGGEVMTCSATGGPSSLMQPLFVFAGKNYSQADLPVDVQSNITRMQNQTYQQLSTYLREVVVRVAVAKEKNVTDGSLPELTELMASTKITEEEIESIIKAQEKNLPANVSRDDLRKQISTFLQRQRGQQAIMQKITELENAGTFKILINAPVGRPLETAGFPSKGPDAAQVKVAIVTDYLCVHCRRLSPEIDQAIIDYGDKVQFTRMIYALQPDGLSGTLARGAYCANKANPEAFWRYHVGAEKVPVEATKAASPDAAKEFKNHALGVAKEAGLDLSAFEKCLDSQDAQEFVQKSVEMLGAAGVDGTPAYFFNGKRVQVAQSRLSNMVKEALTTTASK